MNRARRKLDDLKARMRPAATLRARSRAAAPACLGDVIGGAEARCADLAYWLLETPFDAACEPHAVDPQLLATPLIHRFGTARATVVDPRRTVIVDIETGGFAGTPVFLVGLVLLDQRPLRVRQLLARDYPEEEAILRAWAETAAERDTWVTFNGKSFDEPFLRDRALLHRVTLPPPHAHIDLLHAARRAWRGSVPNFKLGTLEQHILRRERIGDVPSCDVPDLFHHFIRTGNAAPLRPVIQHNQIDLVSATELLLRLSGP